MPVGHLLFRKAMPVGPAGLERAFSASEDLAHFLNFLWGLEGKLLVARKNMVVNKVSIGIDKDLTKDMNRNLNTFKMYCKRRS